MSGKNSFALCLTFLCVFRASAQDSVPTFLNQNWSDQIRFQFWFMDQGSRIMPYDWFMRLEKADSTEAFSVGLDRYGFVRDNYPQPTKNPSPDKTLPIGFAKDTGNGQDWIGLTCAACHTNKITYGAKSWLIEGGPSMLDFDLFLSEMVAAVDQIAKDPQKADRFWKGKPTQAQADQFQMIKDRLDKRKRVNTPPFPAGFGRVDAFGHIFNQVVTVGLKDDNAAKAPDAPASYPFLWDISQHEFVQWNGSAPNLGVGKTAGGSLIRNIGEVLGVFGEFEITKKRTPLGLPSFDSSIPTENLMQIEDWISNLRSPKWPAELGPIDEGDRKKGAELYKEHCLRCHAVVAPDQPVPYPLPVTMESVRDVQTDAQEVNNFLTRTADAGILRGSIYPLDPSAPIFTEKSKVSDLTGYIAMGVFTNRESPGLAGLIRTATLIGISGIPPLDRYKARPLDGIWATAPYLHNGSVASLAELLKPPEKRLPRFCVGDGQYDPVNAGYQTYSDRLSDGCPKRNSLLDTKLPGNSAQGHTYGTQLTDAEKSQLMAYLKSL